ncbi:hypothetical protein GCM10023187_22920 [Nibrella viscosa]|uniref:DUF3298 domain-containing protein n=1 Tax=Nibrella viscosa TaxID=1084524 RepID=A0ABP8KEL3_9BACT
MFTACRVSTSSIELDAPSSPEKPTIQRQQYEYTGAGRCDTTTRRGISFRADYVLLKDPTKASQIINDSVQALVRSSVMGWLDSAPDTRQPTDLAAAAHLFAADYRRLLKDVGMVGGCWELEIKGDTVYVGPQVLTIRMETYANTGGAHPNTFSTYYSFDRATGRQLRLSDLVTDTTALAPIVERIFRLKQGISEEQRLEEEGYFAETGRFVLPEHVGVGRKGLIFYYNPYEIAAYAQGPIEIVVPYREIKEVLQEGVL